MDCISHYFMAKVIVREVNSHLPEPIAEKPFILGSYIGDYTPWTLFHKHTAARSMDWICSRLEAAAAGEPDFADIDSNAAAFKLGLLCHYICDFFCRAHAVDGPYGDLRVHLQYEDFLASYAKTWSESLLNRPWALDTRLMSTPEEISAGLRQAEGEYRQRGQSVEDDMHSAISTSIQILYSMAAVRAHQTQTVPAYNLAVR